MIPELDHPVGYCRPAATRPAGLRYTSDSSTAGEHRQRVWRDWESATSLLGRHVHVNACWLYGRFLSDEPEPEVVSCVYWAEDLELSKAHLDPASANILRAFAQRATLRRVVGVRVDTSVVAWHCQPDTEIEDRYLPRIGSDEAGSMITCSECVSGPTGSPRRARTRCHAAGYVEVIVDDYQ